MIDDDEGNHGALDVDEDTATDAGRPDLPLAVRRRLPRLDPEALGAFFDAFFPRVYGFVRRMVGDEHLAEDLTQDVFMHVHRALPGYDPERELRPWVFTIATNKVRDHWRSRRHHDAQREASMERDDVTDAVPSAAPGPGAGLEGLEADEAIRRAVDALPEGLRTTVVLRAFEGLSFAAIGDIVERSELAVRKRYSRGLAALREVLGPILDIDEGGAT